MSKESDLTSLKRSEDDKKARLRDAAPELLALLHLALPHIDYHAVDGRDGVSLRRVIRQRLESLA